MKDPITAKRLEISGVVQGVGFRPFLFVLANQYNLKGEVSNTSSGVFAEVEGTSSNIDHFCKDIKDKKPLLASVTRIEVQDIDVKGFNFFKIVKSKTAKGRTTLISPDVSICDDCLKELKDANDRRFEYPFINCTNCGPRYTIIQDIPYDRPKTSMRHFQMCPVCQKEYDDPMNRRFHAQPNACPECGPHVFLIDAKGNRLDDKPEEAIALAAGYLKKGKIVAVKGLGGFHLACDAANNDVVNKLRQRKNRPHKPFALMAQSASVLFDHVKLSEAQKDLLESYHRPIVILEKKEPLKHDLIGLAPQVAPFNLCLGIMMPYTPLHYLLLEKGPDILVMTSGNRSGEPLSIDNDDALNAFNDIADYFLFHDRDIYFRADDSIVRFQAGQPRFFRRSRGYAPLPVSVKEKMPPILGCGAGLKSTVCLTKGNYAFLSQHIGNLDNDKVFDFYKDSIAHLEKILDITPEIIAHDLHPRYMSTDYAKKVQEECKKAEMPVKTIAVQHHHAHAVSCMAEHGLFEKVIALTLDGTGYGPDGNIWGGEILVCDRMDFERKAHLSYVPMPGGDAAVLEPWRMAVSILYKAYGSELLNLEIPFLDQVDKEKVSFIVQMIEKSVNSPVTSSAGRIFDAVSSLLCIRHEISHESQAAMELEAIALEKGAGAYGYDIWEIKDAAGRRLLEIDMMSCVKDIVSDILNHVPDQRVSYKFHGAMADAFVSAAMTISKETGIQKAVLSGGVFNNNIILNRVLGHLEDNGLTVYTHTKVPAGDGGISFGQVAVASALENQVEKGEKKGIWA
ncbi:MAG: carbamoyltransferase HypF [Desulfobacteraceae bacterium]|nr:carbamoyltransferase HypF [Desulfobacteraceae bacterium]